MLVARSRPGERPLTLSTSTSLLSTLNKGYATSILDLGIAHINVWLYTLHPGQRHTTIISEAICVDHNQVDECPDAEAPEGEQLEDAADDAPCVEAMHAEHSQK